MATAELVKRHPQLLGILAAVLQGKPLHQVAEAFELPELELVAYCREAGLVPGQKQDPEPQPPEPEASLQREPALGPEESEALRQPVSASIHERQVLEEGARRRGDPERQQDPDAHPFNDESRAGLRQMLDQAEGERKSYLSQPRPALMLKEDPEFRIGFQPKSRLVALAAREQAQRAEKVRQWYAADFFRWGQLPPDDL